MGTAYLTRGLVICHLAQVPYFARIQAPVPQSAIFRVPVLTATFPAHPKESLTCPSPPLWQGSGPLHKHAPGARLHPWLCSEAAGCQSWASKTSGQKAGAREPKGLVLEQLGSEPAAWRGKL